MGGGPVGCYASCLTQEGTRLRCGEVAEAAASREFTSLWGGLNECLVVLVVWAALRGELGYQGERCDPAVHPHVTQVGTHVLRHDGLCGRAESLRGFLTGCTALCNAAGAAGCL